MGLRGCSRRVSCSACFVVLGLVLLGLGIAVLEAFPDLLNHEIKKVSTQSTKCVTV